MEILKSFGTSLSQLVVIVVIGLGSMAQAADLANPPEVLLTNGFRALPQNEQQEHLRTTQDAMSLLPAVVLSVIQSGGFKLVLCGKSLSEDPVLADRLHGLGKENLLKGAGLTTSSERRVYVLVDKTNKVVEKNGVVRIVLHELGHAYDQSLGFIAAGEDQDHAIQYSLSNAEFNVAHHEAYDLIKGSGIESPQEFFADMFYFYFSSVKTKTQLRANLPKTFAIFENLFKE